MGWNDIDRMFHRSLKFCFSKKKFLFTYPLVASCGVFITLFRALSEGAGDWVRLKFSFFPIFITASILLATGIVLIRAYHNEVKGLSFSFRELGKKSWDLMVSATYLTLPLSMAYLMLWSVIGFFYILKEIPFIGTVVSILLSFVPFLLVLSFIVLALVNMLVIFFLTPAVALRSECSFEMVIRQWKTIQARLLTHIALLFFAVLPVALVLGLLYFAGHLTESTYLIATSGLSYFGQQVVTSFAFSALSTPVVVFFFNFAAESYIYLRKTERASVL
ncbi:MAG: hypothetical protein NTX49_09260 [Chlamydiae bacterium]|nr:hypothetical protein [Chlamydiota bacterium]